MIRILHTESSMNMGGQEIRILNEMLGMKARGYDILLATPEDALLYKKAKEAGIETFPVGMDGKGFVKGVSALASIIRKRKVSIINTHSSRDSWMGSIAGRLTGIKVLRTRHISSKFTEGLLTRLIYGPLNDGILTTGEVIKDQIVSELKIDRRKIHSIPTGIDIEKFRAADGSPVRSEFGIGPGDIVLGTAAVLRSWKGHEYLVKAMPGILKDFPAVKLLLAGGGPIRTYVEHCANQAGVRDSVIFLGHRDDIPAVIAAFDVSVLASYASEGVPQFVLQSMAAGKPVVATTVGGIPEVVKDGVNGILVPPRDPDAIARAVRTLLSDQDTARRMGEAGYEMALYEHTLEEMLDRIEALYKKVMS